MTEMDYDETMQAMNEMYGSDISEDELDGMFIEHIRSKIDKDGFKYKMNDWLEVNDVRMALTRLEASETQTGKDIYVNAAKDYKAIIEAAGYNPVMEGSDRDYIDTQGKLAARFEGRNWTESVNGNYTAPANEKPVNSISDLKFYEMIPYRANRGEVWTENDSKILNEKIVENYKEIVKDIRRMREENASNLDNYDEVAKMRKRDGIMGNEPYLERQEARKYLYGKTYLEVQDDYYKRDEKINKLRYNYYSDFYEHIYETSLTRFDHLPEATADGKPASFSVVTRETYNALGEGYAGFYRQKVAKASDMYLQANTPDVEKNTVDSKSLFKIDYSRTVEDVPPITPSVTPFQNVNDRTRMYQRSLLQQKAVEKTSERKVPEVEDQDAFSDNYDGYEM